VDGLEESSSEAISRGLEDGTVKLEIRSDEADAIALAVFEVDDGLPE
jgi:hypothetical protein